MFKCKNCSKMGKKCKECENYITKRCIENEILRDYISHLPNEDEIKKVIEELLREEGLEPI